MSNKKVFTDESLETFVDEIKSYTDEAVSTKANTSHSHAISDVTNLQDTLDGKVPNTRTINGKELITNISLSASDVGAANSSHTHDDRYYTETEIDTKVSTIDTSITKIVNGTTVVAKADHASTADNATASASASKATHDASGSVITSTYETKTDASSKLSEAKLYADGIKNDLLNGAGSAYDTLKELGDLIDDNTDAIDALETVAANKADKSHTHDNYVDFASAQTVSGVKTFSNGLKIGNVTITHDTTNNRLVINIP